MTMMRSPEGEEREIKPAGAASLAALGWTEVKAGKKKEGAAPAAPSHPAAPTKGTSRGRKAAPRGPRPK